jgi:anti-anti-sigma regulatory factor
VEPGTSFEEKELPQSGTTQPPPDAIIPPVLDNPGDGETQAGGAGQVGSQPLALLLHRQWREPDELQALLIRAIEELASDSGREKALRLSLMGADYLDAQVLQLLLAAQGECRRRQIGFEMSDISPTLQPWFGYAGAEALLSDQG